jgi:amidase
VAGAPGGPLAGLRFAVKDLYDVAGEVTSYGNPDWARSHGVAASTAPVVLALLEAGARLVGKTKTVELAFGLTGENVWHGTPINPNAPDRFPGGSSCGSAAAVAAGEVDFAMGSDTGGSVRIPASYCGVFGFRPSWGAISLAGCCALGPSFDTPGWFAANAAVLARVGGEILPLGKAGEAGPLLQPDDVWANTDPKVAALLDTVGDLLAAEVAEVGPGALDSEAQRVAETTALRGELAQEMERRSSEGQAHATEKGEASRRHAALAASLECSQRYQILINSE